ncbi:hypothetical protein AB1Y20_011060 [Prymnesium parvum]|uniref:EF-hand domain-containing protein n=1 Tax=Prymnesium parvum TaxID=97485 RepID=A0AB34IPB7_PRYPA
MPTDVTARVSELHMRYGDYKPLDEQRQEALALEAKWWRRASLVVLLSVFLPVLSKLFHSWEESQEGVEPAHDSSHLPSHEGRRLNEEHHELAQHTVVIFGKELNYQGFLDAQSSLLIVLFLVFATVGFEFLKDSVEEKFEKYAVVLMHIWSELTVLGFLALVTFILVKMEILQTVSELVYKDEEHLVHMFEAIHFSLFFVLVMFLFLSLWLLLCAAESASMWEKYRAFIRPYEKPSSTMTVLDFGREACERELHAQIHAQEERVSRACKRWPRLAAALGPTLPFAMKCVQDFSPFIPQGWDLHVARERMRFQRMRHGFLLRPLDVKKPQTLPPADFEFAWYLLEATKKHFEHVMHLGVVTWVRIALAMVVIFEVSAFFGQHSFWILFISGWALFVAGSLSVQHFEWIVCELTPIKDLDNFEAELESLRFPSVFAHLFQLISPAVRKLLGRGLYSPSSEGSEEYSRNYDSSPSASRRPASPLKSMSTQSECAYELSRPNGGVAEAPREPLWKGLYDMRPLPRRNRHLRAENKQSILFFFLMSEGHGGGHGGGGSSTDELRQAAAHPAALLLQTILLLSSLYFTFLVVYRVPHGVWDWKVAMAAFPVLMVDIFVAPKLIEPMVLALNTETFRDKKLAAKIENDAKLAKFARAAKLLHAMRSRARVLKSKGKQEVKKPKQSEKEFLAGLGEEKRKKAFELKEAFDNFDTDKSETLSLSELMPLMTSLGMDRNEAEVQQLVDELDTDNSKSVSFVEFAERMLEEEEEVDTSVVCKEIFEMLDTDHSGSLSVNEIETAFKQLHTGLTAAEMEYIIRELDEDETGDVSEEEFIATMSKVLESE